MPELECVSSAADIYCTQKGETEECRNEEYKAGELRGDQEESHPPTQAWHSRWPPSATPIGFGRPWHAARVPSFLKRPVRSWSGPWSTRNQQPDVHTTPARDYPVRLCEPGGMVVGRIERRSEVVRPGSSALRTHGRDNSYIRYRSNHSG